MHAYYASAHVLRKFRQRSLVSHPNLKWHLSLLQTMLGQSTVSPSLFELQMYAVLPRANFSMPQPVCMCKTNDTENPGDLDDGRTRLPFMVHF